MARAGHPLRQARPDLPRRRRPEGNRHLAPRIGRHTLDQRTADLGAAAADELPRWARDLLGDVPDEDQNEARAAWETKAGAVAVCRALTGRDATDSAPDADDVAPGEEAGAAGQVEALDVLGPAPKPGLVEYHAAYCAGWEALGRPQADREEFELSDGALRARVRAYERQQTWAPRYVANELAGTRQAAAHHRHTATLRRTEADATTDPQQAAELRRAGTDAAALAAELDRRTTELEQVEQARGEWLAQTTVDRIKHDRALIALTHRNADRDDVDDRVTAEDWLSAHTEAMAAEDDHRPITESDVHDQHEENHADTGSDAGVDTAGAEHHGPVLETEVPDVRDLGAAEPDEVGEDDVRVPTAAESEDAVTRARRALDEIRAQQAYEASLDTAEDRDLDPHIEHTSEQDHDEDDDGYGYADERA
ncbi:hypothetical protein [Pseudonocardia sp. HH130630-07]|uniref:hypothetical protein n=1 Tax=Pseudonocardia sp. HH130630-07 TaxID=1690815 RepID=UPI000814F51C|nr:hypothetical protein [Pseudonocardia sp. HH130630-07]ANY06375.1 hypothetical protein AFB00_08810 [Pseudonocardia sp. HH130630-07]